MTDKPQLSKRAFGDVDLTSIDYEKDALYVMESVINEGTPDDFLSIKNFYDDEKIRSTIIYSKVLGPKEINFCSLLFKINPQDFKYPTTKSANPEPWDFSGA